MQNPFRLVPAILLGALLTVGSPVAPIFAGEAEARLLQSYVGSYTGRGELRGQTRESVACRLNVTSSAAQRLRYSGRCVLAGETVPLSGSLSYSEARDRYEASASGMSTVVGQKRGNGVSFTMGRNYRRAGQSGTFQVSFVLSGGSIQVNFAIADRKNGQMTARVPMSR